MPKTKCPQCLKLTLETETDNCDKCDKKFCQECLTYYEELAFCGVINIRKLRKYFAKNP